MSESPDERTISLEEIIDKPVGGKSNIVLDATVLNTFIGCPRLMDFRHNHNLVSINGKSNSLECGSIVHVFLEYFYRSMSRGIKRDEAIGFGFTAAQTYIQGCKGCAGFTPTPELPKPACGHKVDEFPGLRNTPKDDEGYKTGWSRVLATCQEYVDFWKNDHWVTLDVETVRGKVLYEDDEIRILWKAKLDWVVDTNQGIFAADHKTMKQKRDTVSLNHQFIGQAIITDQRSIFVNKIGFQKTVEAKEKFQRVMVPYSAARLAEWQSETLPFYAKLLLMYHETGHFPPNYNQCDTKYGHCAFKDVCESDPGMREYELKRLFVVGPEWNPTNDEE